MAHPDIAASMARSMAIETKTKSAESATTADEEVDASASEEASGESSQDEGGEDGADSQAGDGDGEDGGESGSQDTESDDTTAEEGESDASSEEQASEEEGEEAQDDESGDEKPDTSKWDEGEQKNLKAWFGKEAEKVKPSPITKKLLKIAGDNQSKAQEATQQVATLNTHIAGIAAHLLNHDFEEINSIAEELGGEKLPFDTRTPEDHMKETVDGYNAFFDALEKGFKDQPETWAAIQTALDPIYRKTMEKIGTLKEESLLQKAREAGRKEAGKPVKGSVSKTLETKATQNFTDMKARDPEAQARFESLKPFFEGGVLRDKNRVYALNPQLADKLGKAVEFFTNFDKKYLPKIRESVKGEEKARRLLKAPPSGRKPEGERPSGRSPAKNNKFDTFAGPKILERLRG